MIAHTKEESAPRDFVEKMVFAAGKDGTMLVVKTPKLLAMTSIAVLHKY